MIDLTGKTVFITGAAGEIGTATARTMAAAGAQLVLHDLRTESLAPLTTELGDRAATATADLAHPESTARLWDQAVQAFGRIDVLLNNAGIYPPAPLDQPLDEWIAVWNRSLAVNLVSPGALARAAVETFSAQPGGGIIISIASRAAFLASGLARHATGATIDINGASYVR